MSLYYLEPGLVRDLRCSYDTLREKALLCEWREPERVFTSIQTYQVEIMRSNVTILKISTEALLLQTKGKLAHEEIYTVKVGVLSNSKETFAKTLVNFTNSGASISSFSASLTFICCEKTSNLYFN